MGVAIAIATLTTGCTNDDGADTTGAGTVAPQTSSETNTTTPTTTTLTTSGATVGTNAVDAGGTTIATTSNATGPVDTTAGTSTTIGTTIGTTDGTSTTGSSVGMLPFEETFEGPDGAPWPAPWVEAGSAVVSATLVDGRGRLVGETGRVARMVLPGFVETDVDVTITVEFDDWTQQGFGLYVRQNGGALQETEPPGQGYATYVEGGFMQSIGIWRETGGVEDLLVAAEVPGGALVGGVPYHLRLQCHQQGPSTRLRTRIWPVGEPEPNAWQVELLDDTPVLQGTAGSFALDVYNYVGMGGVLVDDLRADAFDD